jgi:hypothetical protein
MAERVNCTGTVKDKKTGQGRQCRKTASADDTPTLCHICLRTLQLSSDSQTAAKSNRRTAAKSNPRTAAKSNPDVAAEPNPDVAAEPGPDVAAEPDPDVAAEPDPDVAAEPDPDVAAEPDPDVAAEPDPDVAAEPGPDVAAEPDPDVAAEPNPAVAARPSLHIAAEFNPAEPTPPTTPTGISAAPIASQNAAPIPTPRKTGPNVAPFSTPRKAGRNVATPDTSNTPPPKDSRLFQTPQKVIHQSSADGTLDIRRKVFRYNLKGLILMKMGCEEKIDFLHRKVERAVAWEGLDNMKKSLTTSKAWGDWLTDMGGRHDTQAPLRAQEMFTKLLTTARSILIKNKKSFSAEPHCFRNLNDKKIDFKAPHDPQKSLKSLRPDIVVVKQEHQDSVPPLHDQFLCAMEHKRSRNFSGKGQAIQDSLIKSVQIFNDNFFRQYLYSVFIAGTQLRLFQLDRGGIVYFAGDLNIQEHPEAFLKFVAWLSFSPPEQLGYGSPPGDIGGVPINCEWDKPSIRPNAEVLDARGTTVWMDREPVSTELHEGFAQLTLNDDKIFRVVKMQWSYEARKTTEADFLRAISGMSGVPKLIANHEGVSTKDFGTPDAKITRMHFESKGAGVISIDGSSYPPSSKKIDSINLSDPKFDDNSTGELVFRQQRWILVSYCGASIDDESDPISGKLFTTVDRLRALRSVIYTISDLFCEKRIIHRDISVNNVRIAPASDSKHSAGNLIDFDMASYWGAGGSGSKSRTGTPLYMAMNVLCSGTPLSCHLPWYDIESVFWVLLIVEGKRLGEKFKTLTGTDLVSLGYAKSDFVNVKWRRVFMKSAFMTSPVGTLLRRLRGFLFDSQWTPKGTINDDKIFLDYEYEMDRFKTGKEDGKESERWKDMADALKESLKTIGTWFDECINEVLASENTK